MTYIGDDEQIFFKTQNTFMKNPLGESQNFDAATVATSAVEQHSVFSKASVYSKKCVELADKVAQEKKQRA